MAKQKINRYVETTEFPGNTHLEISVYYSLGGMSYFTGGKQERGFYLSVTPVKKGNSTISFTAFTGTRMLILPANRYSEKQLKQAVKMSKQHEQELIDDIRVKQKSA